MLSTAGHPSHQIAERFDPSLRFECWTITEAQRLARDYADDICDGYAAGFLGAPCPGPARDDAFRLGWEMGAIAAYRVPPPAWMDACNAQDAADCIGSA
jgi:hypothetical protein